MTKVTLNKRHNNLLEYFRLIESDDIYELKSNPHEYIKDIGRTYQIEYGNKNKGATYTCVYADFRILYESMYFAMKLGGYKFTNDHILLEEK